MIFVGLPNMIFAQKPSNKVLDQMTGRTNAVFCGKKMTFGGPNSRPGEIDPYTYSVQ
jgi:hypothetical protein